jgi:membrane protease YdiL (CAAX protease family)
MGNPETKTESNPPPQPAAPDFGAAHQPSYLRTLFLGPEGLRPGWGIALYAVLYYLLRQLAEKLAWLRVLGAGWLWSSLLDECSMFVAAAIPALVLARIERRPWRVYGLPATQAFGKLFWIGSLSGFAGISLLIVGLYGSHALVFGHIVLHGVRIAKFAAFWAAMFLAVGLFEEFSFRGYPQFTLGRGIGFWPAAIALSCTFGLFHLTNEGEQWPGLLAAAFIGLFFCLTLRRTGNLWFAVGFHAAWDWGETFFYSVPDSGMVAPGHLLSSSLRGPSWLTGGTVGPEGSLLCFIVIALAWLAFDRAYPRKTAAGTSKESSAA